ncbi:MAG TPA: hypothetical protein VE734_00095, partial [Terriglobales bacterium]|nr:hypothetical protein [Terriglobales bacterium]
MLLPRGANRRFLTRYSVLATRYSVHPSTDFSATSGLRPCARLPWRRIRVTIDEELNLLEDNIRRLKVEYDV